MQIETLTEGFDLDRFIRTSGRVDLSEVEWDRVHESPTRRPTRSGCLRYMMDIEAHTVIFLRDLLATHAAFDPERDGVLSCWNYEEFWHGEAFSRLLGEAEVPVAPDLRRGALRLGVPQPHAAQPLDPPAVGLEGIHEPPRHAPRVGTGRPRLRRDPDGLGRGERAHDRARLPLDHGPDTQRTLIQVLQAISKQERRHFAFYRAQARFRMERSARARRLVRWSLDQLWAPVGTGVRPQSETDFVVTYLFDNPDGLGLVREMDRTISELPGLEGSHYLRDAVQEAAVRLGRRNDLLRPDHALAAGAQGSRGRTRVPSGVSMTSRPIAASSSRRSSEVA